MAEELAAHVRLIAFRWGVAALFVAWLVAELVAAFDGIPETWTLTSIVVSGLRPWVTAGILAVGIPLLIWHFWYEYRRRQKRIEREEHERVLLARRWVRNG